MREGMAIPIRVTEGQAQPEDAYDPRRGHRRGFDASTGYQKGKSA